MATLKETIDAVLAEEGAISHDVVDLYVINDDGERIVFHFSDARIVVESGVRDWDFGSYMSGVVYEPLVLNAPSLKFVENRGMESSTLTLSNADGSLSGWLARLDLIEGAGIKVSRAWLAPDGKYYADELTRGYVTLCKPAGDEIQIQFTGDTVNQAKTVTKRKAFHLCPYQFNYPNRPTQPRTERNVALSSNGATATASASHTLYAPEGAINGDRTGSSWGNNGGWSSPSNGTLPQWIEVTFAEESVIDRIVVVTLMDNYTEGAEPDADDTFTLHGMTDFKIEYWDGDSWEEVASYVDNDRVMKEETDLNLTTTKIRVYCTKSKTDGVQDNIIARVLELEAWVAGETNPASPDGETEQDWSPCGWQTSQGADDGASLNSCDKTLYGENGCRAHRNEERFGGFDISDTVVDQTTSGVDSGNGWGDDPSTGRHVTHRPPDEWMIY